MSAERKTTKRKRKPPIRDPRGTIYAYWNQKEGDVEYHSPSKQDGGWLHSWFSHARLHGGERSFLEEMEERGYDVTTIRFSVTRSAKTAGDS